MALAFQPMLRFYRLSPLWGLALPAIAAAYTLFTVQSALRGLARPRRPVEGPRPGAWRANDDRRRRLRVRQGPPGRELPVASCLVRRELRPAILAFYRFARAADDVADHAQAAPEEKLEQLARMEAGAARRGGANPEGVGAACRPAGARPHGPACARPAGSLPPRRHQAALRRLGRADGLLPLFGGAGRPLRARRAWREPRRSGRPTTRSAPRCR